MHVGNIPFRLMLFCQNSENIIFWLHMSYLFGILVPLDVTSKVKFKTELSRFYGCYAHCSALSLFILLSYLKTQQQAPLLRTPSIFLSIPLSKSSPCLCPEGLFKGNIPRKCPSYISGVVATLKCEVITADVNSC